MSIPYTAGGRTSQKSRTEQGLVAAARLLMAGGRVPTVEEAAAEAGISRTTAYRYFPNQRDLLIAGFPFIEAPSLLPAAAPADVIERLDYVLKRYLRITLDNEPALRAALRLSLEDPKGSRPLLRRGRTLSWICEALEPARATLGQAGIDRLAKAIRATAGIESLIWLTDVADMSRADAVELMKWSARALLRDALGTKRSAASAHRRRRK